jgi:hypothetical protein
MRKVTAEGKGLGMRKGVRKRKVKGTNEGQQTTKPRAQKIKSKKCIIIPPSPSMFTSSIPVPQCRSHFHAQSEEMKRFHHQTNSKYGLYRTK